LGTFENSYELDTSPVKTKKGVEQLNGVVVGFGRKTNNVNKLRKRLFNGHEFKLFFTTNNKNAANRKAKMYRKHGFHTRVIELYPGIYAAYRRLIRVGKSSHDKNNANMSAGKEQRLEEFKNHPK
jgi:hypothetical protein